MIRAVTFDVWETMIHDDPILGAERGELRISGMAAALRRGGFAIKEDRVRTAYHASWQRCEERWSAGSEVDPHEQLLILLALIDPSLPDRLPPATLAAVEDAYVSPVFAKPPVLNAGLPELLHALRAGGCRLGLICNTGRTPGFAMRRLLDGYGVLASFDVLAFSNEEGIRKPDPEIFRRVLRQLGTPASAAVHVGDDIITDIAGAKRSGMRAVLMRATYPADLPVEPDAFIGSLSELPAVLERLDGGG